MSDYPLDWATGDFINRYTAHSSRHSSPERDLDHGEMALSPSPISPVLITSEKLFCRRDNVDHCIAYLNQELGILGFSSLFTPSRNGRGPSDTFDIVKLINTTYELLQQQQRNMKQRTDLEEKNLRTECDNEHLVQMQKRLKEQLESAQREIAMGSERERQLQAKLLKVKEELKAEREEVKRTKANSVHAQKQYDHELRKKEREFNKLKERLHQLLTDKNQDKRIGLEILHSVQRPGGQRAQWKTGGKSEEEMYRMLIMSYEERQKELMVENNDLRESLCSMQTELIDLLNQQNEECDSNLEGGEMSDTGSIDRLSSGHFHMPYDIVREGIETSLREKWRLLKSKLQGANKGSNGSPAVQQEDGGKLDKSEDIIHLQRQLENYRHVVQQQENLIESLQSKACSSSKDSLYLADSLSYEEQEKLHIDLQLYEKQREEFERERKQLTDAATLLGLERKKFEDERASFYKQQLSTPQRINSGGGRKSKSTDGPRLQHSTPSFSPAPRTSPLSEKRMSPNIPRDGPVEIPSTEELYRALSLNTDKNQTINELNETPLKGYSEADGPRTSSSSANQPSSGDSAKENYCDPNMVGSRQARRINEHAQNVKRALQMKRSLSGDL